MNGVGEILVGRQRAGGCRSTFEDCRSEISGFGLDPLRIFAESIAILAVASDAIATILRFAGVCVSVQASDLAFLSGKRRRRTHANDDTQVADELLLRSYESHDEPPRLRKQNRARIAATGSRPAWLATVAAIRLPRRSVGRLRSSSPLSIQCGRQVRCDWSSSDTTDSQSCRRRCFPDCLASREGPAATSGLSRFAA